jgi:hypothetical protein
MDATPADRGAFAEAAVFLSYFDDLPDPRQRGKVVYPLDEVFGLALLALLAVLAQHNLFARFPCCGAAVPALTTAGSRTARGVPALGSRIELSQKEPGMGQFMVQRPNFPGEPHPLSPHSNPQNGTVPPPQVPNSQRRPRVGGTASSDHVDRLMLRRVVGSH